MKCPVCGAVVPEGAATCPACPRVMKLMNINLDQKVPIGRK